MGTMSIRYLPAVAGLVVCSLCLASSAVAMNRFTISSSNSSSSESVATPQAAPQAAPQRTATVVRPTTSYRPTWSSRPAYGTPYYGPGYFSAAYNGVNHAVPSNRYVAPQTRVKKTAVVAYPTDAAERQRQYRQARHEQQQRMASHRDRAHY